MLSLLELKAFNNSPRGLGQEPNPLVRDTKSFMICHGFLVQPHHPAAPQKHLHFSYLQPLLFPRSYPFLTLGLCTCRSLCLSFLLVPILHTINYYLPSSLKCHLLPEASLGPLPYRSPLWPLSSCPYGLKGEAHSEPPPLHPSQF